VGASSSILDPRRTSPKSTRENSAGERKNPKGARLIPLSHTTDRQSRRLILTVYWNELSEIASCLPLYQHEFTKETTSASHNNDGHRCPQNRAEGCNRIWDASTDENCVAWLDLVGSLEALLSRMNRVCERVRWCSGSHAEFHHISTHVTYLCVSVGKHDFSMKRLT